MKKTTVFDNYSSEKLSPTKKNYKIHSNLFIQSQITQIQNFNWSAYRDFNPKQEI